MTWFHCTRPENAKNILRGGFWVGRITPEYADYFSGYVVKMLTKAERDKADKIWEQGGDLAEAKYLASAWNKKFSSGTFIWLGKHFDLEYGDVCLEVTLPRDARPMGGDRDMGWVFYVPHPISPKHFKVVEIDEETRRESRGY